MIRIYTYAKCSTCRAATTWLRAHGIAFEERAIRETPPTEAELVAMARAHDGQLRRLFNTSGMDYRAQDLASRFESLSQAEALALLRGNGNLVKRPFVIGEGVALVGFDEKHWSEAFRK